MESIIDVLRAALDGDLTGQRVRAMTDGELAELADRVNAFYSAWKPPALADGEMRAYLGGWVAGNVAAPEQRALLDVSLVYAHTTIIHDPIAAWFDRDRPRLAAPDPIRYPSGVAIAGSEADLLRSDGYFALLPDTARTRDVLAFDVETLAGLTSLIAERVVIPVPYLRWQYLDQRALLSTIRHDLRDPTFIEAVTHPVDVPAPAHDQIRGMELALQNAGQLSARDEIRRLVESPSYYLTKTLAIASRAHSRYVPPAATDWALLEARLRRLQQELRRVDRIDLSVIPGLLVAELPFLGRLKPETVIAIRREEDAFAGWRAGLRNALRTVETTPSSGKAFVEDARQALQDILLPEAAAVGRLVSRSARFRTAAPEGVVDLVLAAAATGGSILLGADPAQAAIPAGISVAGRYLWKSTFGQRSAGPNAVLAHLHRGRIG